MKKNTETLSARELEVLYLIAFEYTNREIADKLFLATSTVATYRNNILTKLSVSNSAGIVRVAFQKRILILDNDKIILGKNIYSF